MNQRRLLIAAVFHFKHPVGKDSKKHHKLTKYSVSFSYQSKQGSRCCINFLNELDLSNFYQSEHKNWTVVERDQRVTMVRKVSLKFIRLLRVVFSSQVTEGVITTRSNRMKFRLEKSEKPPSSLHVFLNDWLNFCV